MKDRIFFQSRQLVIAAVGIVLLVGKVDWIGKDCPETEQ